jgi:hypothetical protein
VKLGWSANDADDNNPEEITVQPGRKGDCRTRAAECSAIGLRGAIVAGWRCRGEAQGFFEEHRDEARYRSELAYLLGQIRGVMEHCRDLEGRYRDERICLVVIV